VRAVLDTNVVLAGLLWRGAPHAHMEQVRAGTLGLVSSPTLIAALARIVTRAKFRTVLARSATDPERLIAELQLLADIIAPPPLPAPVCRDPDDDTVLALAVAARVDFIVSGDGDLLVLGNYAEIPILTPALMVLMLDL
jgi:putative PIN family toxin of toxin-antitoxin system